VLLTDGKCVEDGSNNSEQKNGAQVVEEKSVRHEVAGIQIGRASCRERVSVRV
jgi:hypothetical protein